MKWLRDNSLSVALVLLFAASAIGHAWSGWIAYNEELIRDGAGRLALGAYLISGQFGSSLFENWESEFLQMWAYVMLTAYLYQRGSPESNDPDQEGPQDREAPRPARDGRFAAAIYSHSLGLALLVLFAASFTLHSLNSTRLAADEALRQGEAAPTLIEHLASAEFWFESFQNWQSEFLSTAVLIVLGIFLREKGSPESKPVTAPNSQTGAE